MSLSPGKTTLSSYEMLITRTTLNEPHVINLLNLLNVMVVYLYLL